MGNRPGFPYTPGPDDGTPIQREFGSYASQNVPSHRGITVPESDAPKAATIQEGINIGRLPDVAFQPEVCTPVSAAIPPTLCSLGFAGSTEWTTALTYTVQANRKLIVVDAWVQFTNPYTSQIASARLVDEFGKSLGCPVRLQQYCCGNPRNRGVARGKKEIYLQLKRDTASDGWNYGYFFGRIIGWDVVDQSPGGLR